MPNIQYNFKSFSQIPKIEKNSLIDVIGICTQVKPLEEFTSKSSGKDLKKKEIMLIDKSKKGIRITNA